MNKLLLLIIIFSFNSASAALSCFGTEPFWSAKVSDEAVILKLWDDKQTLIVSDVSAPAGMPNIEIGHIRILSDKRGPLAVLTANSCSDGMSDEDYPKEIILFSGSTTLYGCCRAGNLGN